MNLHEYQSKQLFERAGIPIPMGVTVEQTSEVANAASEIDSDGWVTKPMAVGYPFTRY